MTVAQRVVDQVHGIFSRCELQFSVGDDGRSFTVPYESTACYVEVLDWAPEIVVQLRGVVLENPDVSGERRARLFERFNEINRDGAFGTIWLGDDPNVIYLEHHILADSLDEAEVLHALGAVARRANELDDQLKEQLESGERWIDVEERDETGEGDDAAIDA